MERALTGHSVNRTQSILEFLYQLQLNGSEEATLLRG
jgi:hypothetical protein